jgi:hypothetical protein
MKNKVRFIFTILSLIILLTLASQFISCGKPETETPPPSIVPNLTASPANAIDLTKYQLTEKEPDPDGAELISVGFGAEGAYIDVSYRAPPALAKSWMQGDIFVVNEKTGVVYNDTVLMPVVGWLFQRPVDPDQVASVMLVNRGLKSGDTVIAVLGKFKREHITVK